MRVLVVKLSSLGDLFHALPAVAQVRQALGAELDWVVNEPYVELVRRFEPVHRVIGFPRKNFLSRADLFLEHLRRDKYDYVFDMQGLMKSALVAKAARADRRIGPSFHREGSRLFYDAVTGPSNKDRHAVDENFDLLNYLKIPRGPVTFPVEFDRPEGLPSGKPLIALLPCSRWDTKNWPPAHFITLAQMLHEHAHLYIFGAREDHDTCRYIAEKTGSGITNMCGRTSMIELGGWLSVMDLAITVDSGPMHIAAAAGTTVLALFGPTDHRRTGPYGDRHLVLHRDDLACRPCLSRKCRLKEKDIRCLGGLSPEHVAKNALELLAKKRGIR
ncbi:MAG TPA: glycosyltransferase family 9 protein [Kiritimatiellia bacterium]|nr:glycosyltransferase family 9 protein [Kiritimatiellia bacterium]